MSIKLASRQSELAKFQAFAVEAALEKEGHQSEIYFRPSMGDLNLDLDLSKTAQKGVFTSDFLESLKKEEVAAVVHSWKDLPTDMDAETSVVATLKREDTRDLFFLKKESLKKKSWKVLSSSPRRKFHLQEFFSFLTSGKQELQFKEIRGNIPTRFNKFLQDQEADAFCVAYAAVKRLLHMKEFNQKHPGIWKQISKACQWCLLPESHCPSAAAQAAIAVETLKKNEGLNKHFQAINQEQDFKAVQEEREILKSYGGGCHLALGVSVVFHKLGKLTFTKGWVNEKKVSQSLFEPKSPYPSALKEEKICFVSDVTSATRKKRAVEAESLKASKRAFVVTRKEALPENLITSEDVLFCSGVKSWKALFEAGYWVQGCLDQLGEELFVADLFDQERSKFWLSHTRVQAPEGFELISGYELEKEIDLKSQEDKDYFVWTSGQDLQQALQKHSYLKSKIHFLGMGRSQEVLDQIQNEFSSSALKVYPYYSLEQLKKDIVL